ncbi:GntR family transcriptional regulator [Chelativorans salis]|uniref:GntR family transcriptional regulator n=1 Tax=Chelativorans salis TaxID=2978478 RepID=A0ABT2LK54_9HYPH|nr:GntR family transcriptional regulator [Chelativorans sp. EGI FJ00035]MCT7374053.1 GntR family transcriptional regulator [Chelativorans sp. EGI FJ00035]
MQFNKRGVAFYRHKGELGKFKNSEWINCMHSELRGGINSTEEVTSKLRELIMNGTLVQGERLTETGLAARLAVSRTPVRLALATLEREDLVEGAPNRGFRVRRFSIEDMREIMEVRAVLEGMAARLLAEKGLEPDQNATLQECLNGIAELIASKRHDPETFREFARINDRFHTSIAAFAGNTALQRLMVRNPFRSAPLLHFLPDEEGRAALIDAQRDHIRLVDAIRKGEGTRAEFLMREHGLLPLQRADQLFTNINKNAANQRTDEAS